MMEQRYGRIINVSSVTGPRVATLGLAAYSATKGVISALTRTLALEVAAYGITVNAILPGFIDTPIKKPMADYFQMDEKAFSQWLEKSIPMKWLGTIERKWGYAAKRIRRSDMKFEGGEAIEFKP